MLLALCTLRVCTVMISHVRDLFLRRRSALHGALGILHMSLLIWAWIDSPPFVAFVVLSVIGTIPTAWKKSWLLFALTQAECRGGVAGECSKSICTSWDT